ncbi:3-oxoacyl-ACP reductase FabG [Buchnera aphidicola]|uniref:3-oxoacyl-[acyl-carrier-protein] reductase FabG n=1 Tax=Buchnera aphidicola (Therioaphis trifolii) TaxID=1241884 RepID=A0A4D6YPV0_9GAMM|nr:3-oxoacyl-ACP reductase FabG [Buchnera aphidicola]QCI27395.1 SDR family oxidoreductase [Buchnera aphidicola (Therioaphis trifolii)]
MKKNKKIALITGASRGIGKKIAQELSNNNIIVIGTSTNREGVKKINNMLNKKGYGIILNLNNFCEISQCIKIIYATFKKIDILINSAAIKIDKLFINMSLKEWNTVLKINLTAIFYITQLVVKKMIKKKYGRIITIGSIIGNIGNIGQINYSASKSGIIGFNKTLALEVASKGITANIISPGFIQSGMTKTISKKKKKEFLLKIPVKKFGSKKHISSIILFLISKESSYITGQNIHINGGMYMN